MLQILSLNIGGHRNFREKTIDPQAVAKELRTNLQLDFSRPTVLALQEVIQIAFGDGKVWDIGQLLARELGENYQAFFAPKMSSASHPHATAWQKASYAGAIYGAEGNGLISNLPLHKWPWPNPGADYPGHGVKNPIIVPIGKPYVYSSGNRDTEPRNLIIASLMSDAGAIYCISTHLSTIKGEDRKDPEQSISKQAAEKRLVEVQHILSIVEELREAEANYGHPAAPVILAGDFNIELERQEMQNLQAVFTAQKAHPNAVYTHVKHHLEIDHILLNDPRGVLGNAKDVRVIDTLATDDFLDHLPKVALFE